VDPRLDNLILKNMAKKRLCTAQNQLMFEGHLAGRLLLYSLYTLLPLLIILGSAVDAIQSGVMFN